MQCIAMLGRPAWSLFSMDGTPCLFILAKSPRGVLLDGCRKLMVNLTVEGGLRPCTYYIAMPLLE